MAARYVVFALAACGGIAVSSAQDANDNEDTDLAAAEEFPAEEMINCVSLNRVDRTEVVDENTILFYMADDDIYRNVLPHRCPGLDREESFMYRVTIPQLCNVDVITVIDDAGFGFMPGASCGLGKFQPISEAEAEEIIATAERVDDSG